jgi:hypothetical protein
VKKSVAQIEAQKAKAAASYASHFGGYMKKRSAYQAALKAGGRVSYRVAQDFLEASQGLGKVCDRLDELDQELDFVQRYGAR